MEYYNWQNAKCDFKSIIHCIGTLGPDLIGIELGTYRAESFCTILANCPNVKKLYGVDSYVPYEDCLKNPYDGTPTYIHSQKDVDYDKLIAQHNIQYSGHKERAELIIEDNKKAIDRFKNNFFDFILIDSYMNYEQTKNDIETWYCKLKKGGLYVGHNADNQLAVQRAVREFLVNNNIKSGLSVYDNTWVLKK